MLTRSRSGTADDKTAVPARKAIILVPGMHRCGTSALSGTLNRLGAAIPGELLRPDDYNKKGYFENKRINAWHENLLDELKSRWDDPLPLGEVGLRSICTGDAARDLIAVFRQECDGEPLVLVKDPRLCRLLPLWIDAFAGSDYDLFAILPIRHPFEAAASLQRRDSLPQAHGLALWLQHVLAAERASRGLPRCFVSYDDLLRDWRSTVHRIERTLGLAWPGDIVKVADEIDEFLSFDLRHHQSATDTLPAADALHYLCLRAWDGLMLLCADGRNEATLASLDQVAHEYECALGILGPLVAALDGNLVRVRRQLLERDAAERDNAARREAELRYWQGWVKAEHERLEQDLKAERDNAARREAELRYWQGWVKAEHERLEQDLKAERDNAARREAALQALVEAEREMLEQDLKAERDNAARRVAELQTLLETERDMLEQDLKAERDNAARREAELQTLVEAERDTAHRSARVVEESTAQNRRLSEEVANLQTQLHAITTSRVWRATWPIRRVVSAMRAPIPSFGRRALKFSERRERMPAAAEPLPEPLVAEERVPSVTGEPTKPDLVPPAAEPVPEPPVVPLPEPLVAEERAPSVTGAPTKPDLVSPDLEKLISACFDEAWYDSKYALTERKLRALNHYFTIGAKAGYSPNAVFDEEFYLRVNLDVAGAVQAGEFLCGFEHYIRYGRSEGRSGQGGQPLRDYSVAGAPTKPDLVPPDLAKLISACFDEVWYDSKYALTERKLRALNHYFTIGAKAGYSPNAVFDEEFYLRVNLDVAGAVQAGEFLCGFEHYIRYGRSEGRSGQGRPHDYSHLRPMFDDDWYDRTYELKDEELHGFAHYLAKGARRGYSPYADFDEEFYSAFYSDVRMAISSRGYLCGYEHYVLVGRAESRLTKPVLTKMLDLRYPGLTNSVGIAQAREIERRLAPIATCSGADQESYWILVPTLDPNLFFGGYKALIEFIVGLGSLKRPITVVICYHDDDGAYFRYWITRQTTRIAEAFRTVRIVTGRHLTAPLRLSPTDKIFAYSAWEAHLAHQMATHLKSGLFAWLVQEYEAVFHDYSAEHVITASAYHLPHYPIFNSTELKDYFQHHRLGIFSGDRLPSPRHDFAVFNHALTKLSAPSLAELKSRSTRTLIFYARPESHAKRNLFPLALIALEEMAQQGSFVGSWEFHGVGALTEMTIPVGPGHQLNLHAKMTEAEYIAFMHKVDVGLSLMFCTHPGLIAFEMASVGARVVTNTFDNRSETYLRGLSENIVPCEPTISGIKKALTEAIEILDDFSGRVRGMQINRPQGANSWSEVFNSDFYHIEMGGFLGTDQQIVSERTS